MSMTCCGSTVGSGESSKKLCSGSLCVCVCKCVCVCVCVCVCMRAHAVLLTGACVMQLALAQSSSEKQAWIFQSRLEKEELAVQLAEKEDEIAILQRKVREATNLEKMAVKKNQELIEEVERLQPRDKMHQSAIDDSLTREMSLRCTRTRTRTRIHTLTRTLTRTHTRTRTRTRTRTCTRAHTLARTRTHTPALTHTRTHSHALDQRLAHRRKESQAGEVVHGCVRAWSSVLFPRRMLMRACPMLGMSWSRRRSNCKPGKLP